MKLDGAGCTRRAAFAYSALMVGTCMQPLTLAPAPALAAGVEPSPAAVDVARRAFAAFSAKQLPLADALFSQTIEEWRKLDRGAAELSSLLVARAGVRTDKTDFAAAKADLDEAIALMAPTGEPDPADRAGRARYREYPDAFVQRGLANEGLRNWAQALNDYDKAVSLWGGDGDGVNPFALTYRARAKSEVGDFEGALQDYRAASSIFSRVDKNPREASFARAGEAVTLYGLGRRDEAVRIAKQVTTRYQGLTDLYVLLAADAWDRGERDLALRQWSFACDGISSGCSKYRDVEAGGWLIEVRRWPSALVERQRTFLAESRGGLTTGVPRQ